MEPITTATIPTSQLDALDEYADTVPAELHDVLLRLVRHLRAGDDIVACDSDTALTPNQAAKMLRMSRTHLYRLLDDGVIPSYRVGRDRRVLMTSLIEFEQMRANDQRELAECFAHQQQNREAVIDDLADLV